MKYLLNHITAKLTKLSATLGKTTSITWLVLYIVVFIIYTAMYQWVDPKGFFHSTSTHEEEVYALKQNVVRDIQTTLEPQIDTINESLQIEQMKSLNILPLLEVDKDIVHFVAEVNFKLSQQVNAIHTYKLWFKLSEGYNDDPIEQESEYIYRLRFENQYQEKPNHVYNIALHRDSIVYDRLSHLRWGYSKNNRLKLYVDAMNGFPQDLPNSWLRMLYFSAVTITTLGYGDIVPISHINRCLVGSESILGILIIGLFLNSLAKEIVSRNN